MSIFSKTVKKGLQGAGSFASAAILGGSNTAFASGLLAAGSIPSMSEGVNGCIWDNVEITDESLKSSSKYELFRTKFPLPTPQMIRIHKIGIAVLCPDNPANDTRFWHAGVLNVFVNRSNPAVELPIVMFSPFTEKVSIEDMEKYADGILGTPRIISLAAPIDIGVQTECYATLSFNKSLFVTPVNLYVTVFLSGEK